MIYGHAISETSGKKSRIKKSKQLYRQLVNSEMTSLVCDDNSFVLELGCGSGHFSALIASRKGPTSVYGYDVFDQLSPALRNMFNFNVGTSGSPLPYPNNKFDLIVMNHVYEHIEPDVRQFVLSEVARVLSENGVLYVSTPNRFSIIEPHFKLPFLSWLSPKYALFYSNLFGKPYDCYPVSPRVLKKDFSQFFECNLDKTFEVALYLAGCKKTISDKENPLRFLSWFSPTLIMYSSKKFVNS